ncbi:TFIIF small sub put [Enterospora canceri]|uniref:Protein AF-9 homolog n=1 Tax=Enterospora canceri TaxID=1081671 RepID=A0A1Y1SA46_9MICR|nr:TFIIF small sub put [Enterospora canceri]
MTNINSFNCPLKGYKAIKIAYGTQATLNPNEEERASGLTHAWKIYVKAPPGFIKITTYKLHESFLNNNVVVNATESNPNFELHQKGWGEFTIQIKIALFNNDRIHFSHYLKLHENKKLMINDTPTKVVTSEKKDTLFFKGKFSGKIDPKTYECKFTNENDEYKKIDKCIDYVLDEIEKMA